MRKHLLSWVVLLGLCIIMILTINPISVQSATEPIYEGIKEGMFFAEGNDTVFNEGSSANIADVFTLSATIKTSNTKGIQVLFAKGHKTRGHYELWLLDGFLSFYAPEINGGQAIYPNVFVADGQEHSVMFTYNKGKWCVYLDDVKSAEGMSSGSISPSDAVIAIGSLLDGTYEYEGYIKNIQIYDKCLGEEIPDTEPKLEVVSSYEALKTGKKFVAGADSIINDKTTVNVGSHFTLAAVVQTDSATGAQVLFAKGPKSTGHYELWLDNGKFAFYSPDINGGGAIYTDIFVADGKEHHVAFTYNNGVWYAYLDGAVQIAGMSTGSVTAQDWKLTFGSLDDGGFEYIGYLGNVVIDTQVLSPKQIRELVPDSIEQLQSYTPADRESNYTPPKYSPTAALRGSSRLAFLTALPYIDLSATIGYEGSISKFGGNEDWDWSIYQDEKGEYVLFETYGAGCIYNFTQHRYPTSEEPTFHFYLDDSDTPTYSIKQSEFGKKAPFLTPVSDIYEGPSDNGRGPIWVIRSFVPMEFTSYCKVTSTVELLGNDKARGEGGWGHVTYVLYDTADGLETFVPQENSILNMISSLSKNLTFDPKYSADNKTMQKKDITIKAGETVKLFEFSGEGSVAAIKLILKDENANPDYFDDLRIRLYWDDQLSAAVDAPVGTFFGNEYWHTKCDNTLLLVGTEIFPMTYFKGYNYFPMPFWKSMRMEIYSVADSDIAVSEVELQITPSDVCKYDKNTTGYFVSSPYYEKKDNVYGKNSIIAQLTGTGHMVYGVLSGYGISSGCEGDVRVFFDGREAPEMESDGSESWASYGWGFVTPPECNPFSGYNGLPNSNSYWSEVRLTLGDSYFFKNSIRFELEHGGANEGMGSHSGQIFCYMLPEETSLSAVTDRIDLSDTESLQEHNYKAAGDVTSTKVTSAYANGMNNANSFSGKVFSSNKSISFDFELNANNNGVLINRTFSQQNGRQGAKVYIDGVEVIERIWYTADSNSNFKWSDDSFQVPAKYTAGKDRITVTIEPIIANGENITWNAAGYEVISIVGNARSGKPDGDLPENPPATQSPGTQNTQTKDGLGLSKIIALVTATLLLVACAIGIPMFVSKKRKH